MIFYIIFFILVSIPILLINKKNNFFAKLFFCFICVLFFSLRDFSVGSDTYSYYDIFLSSPYVGIMSSAIEPLFILFNKLIYFIYPNFSFYLLCYSCLFIYLWFFSINNYLKLNKDIAFLCFISFSGYLLSFNIERQSLAMAICVFSVYYLFRNNNLLFLIVVLISCFFHYSAVVFLLSYFIVRFSNYPLFIFLITFFVSYIVSLFGINFFSEMSDRYDGYSTAGDGVVGFSLILFILFQFILFYFVFRKFFKEDVYFKYFLSLFSFGAAFFFSLKLLSVPDQGPGRLPLYFLIFNVFLFPFVFSTFKAKSSLILAKFIFYLFCCFYFLYGINSGFAGLKDYSIHVNFLLF